MTGSRLGYRHLNQKFENREYEASLVKWLSPKEKCETDKEKKAKACFQSGVASISQCTLETRS